MKIFIYFLLLINILIAENNVTKEIHHKEQLEKLIKKLDEIQEGIKPSNIWLNRYNNYTSFIVLDKELKNLNKDIKNLNKKRKKSKVENARLDRLKKREKVIKSQLELLDINKESPFKDLLHPEELTEIPQVSNPLSLINAFSYIRQISEKKDDYLKRLEELKILVNKFQDKRNTLYNIYFLEPYKKWKNKLTKETQKLEMFENSLEIVETTAGVYEKKVDEAISQVYKSIREQFKDILNIFTIIFILLLISFVLKLIVKKYIKDNERYYTINKAINTINIALIVLVLIFSYIHRIQYFSTVLGFASAGIAIAMKDWFMSILGWLVIVIGGSMRVGDRVKFVKDGMYYVGDILDISLFRITIKEDVTLTTYRFNKRSGRIIFIPNNYIFTTMFANYTHDNIKTVWDGIEVRITFDSNHKKAKQIAESIAKKYSKGYIDMTRRQLNKLRDKYSVKNTTVEPKVLSFIEDNGMNIIVYYLTNSYATLTLRSDISEEIINAFNKEEDIKIAYPTRRIYVNNKKEDLANKMEEDEESL